MTSLSDDAIVDYVLRYGGRCLGCADAERQGICDSTGMPCEFAIAGKAVKHVLKAIRYGVEHGYLAEPFTAAADLQRERLAREVEDLRSALKPFAGACEKVERFIQARSEQGGSPVMPFKDFRLAHFQAARAAVERGEQK